MHWKSWPYWIRGLLLGLLVGVLVDIYLFLFRQDFFYSQPTCLAIGICDRYSNSPALVFVSLTILFVGFLSVGSCAGYLYGKIKNRKSLPNP